MGLFFTKRAKTNVYDEKLNGIQDILEELHKTIKKVDYENLNNNPRLRSELLTGIDSLIKTLKKFRAR